MKENQQSKNRKFPPVRQRKREREYSTLPEQKSYSNCDIPAERSDKRIAPQKDVQMQEKQKARARGASFFREILTFLRFFCGMADAGKSSCFGAVWRLADSVVLGILRRFGKRSETA